MSSRHDPSTRTNQSKAGAYRFAVLALLVLLVGVAANAQTCSTSITACGCAIKSAGTYTVNANLTASQGLLSDGACIDVSASNVKLLTNGYNITGHGTGIGIHLLSGKKTIVLSAAGPQSTYTTISGWQYGVESQAQSVVSEGFYYENNSTGLFLNAAVSNSFGCLGSFDNTVYGIWIAGGSGNQIDYSGVWDNGVAGIYLGCSATGPTGTACNGSGNASDSNFVFGVLSYTTVAESYGLVVENGSTGNALMDNQFFSNTIDDVYDGNATSSSNLWHSNLFTTANKSYIN